MRGAGISGDLSRWRRRPREWESGSGFRKAKNLLIKKKTTEGLIFYYHNSGFQISVKARSTSANGCVLMVKLCLPYDWERTNERLVGLVGSPDGEKSNDWMDRDNNPVAIPTDNKELKKEPAYTYCTTNWST